MSSDGDGGDHDDNSDGGDVLKEVSSDVDGGDVLKQVAPVINSGPVLH